MRLGWKGWLVAVVWAGVVGCGGDAADEGQRVLPEELSAQSLWLDGEPLLISRRMVGGEPRLHLMPLSNPEAACEAGWSPGWPWLEPVSQVLDEPTGRLQLTSDSLVWVTETGEGPRSWRLLDLDCRWHDLSLDDVVQTASMQHFSPTLDGIDVQTVFARTASNELWRLDAYAGTATQVATGVTHLLARPHNPYALPAGVLTVEQGEIVLRSAEGHEEARYGDSVTHATYHGGTFPTHAYADSEGVHFVEDEETAPILVEPGGCEPVLWHPLLFVLSPCDERRLVVHDLSHAGRYEYMNDVKGVLRFARPDPSGPPELLVAAGAQGSDEVVRGPGGVVSLAGPHEAVWLARTPDERMLVAEGVVSVTSAGTTTGQDGPLPTDFRLVLESEGDTRAVGRFSPEEGLEIVRDGLAGTRSATMVYTSIEGDLADVARLHFDSGELEPLARDVPVAPTPRMTSFPAFGDDSALVYIRDADPETLAGTLEVRHPSGQVEVIDHDVTSFVLPGSLFGDSVLIAYTVVDAGRAGIQVTPDALPAHSPAASTP